MAKTKTFTIKIGSGSPKKSYNLNGATTLNLTDKEVTDKNNVVNYFQDNVNKITASGNNLTLSTIINGKPFDMTLKNAQNLKTIKVKANGFDLTSCTLDELITAYKDNSDYEFRLNKSGATVTGSFLDDIIDTTPLNYAPTTAKAIKNNTGLTIKAGSGNDEIIGTKYNDTITGGAGENTIVVKKETFGNDTINLTSKEGLTIDLSDYGDDYTSLDSLKGKIKVSGKNLEITLPEDETKNYGKLVLKNFAKTNVTGNTETAYVKVKLNNGTIVNLNTDEIFENSYSLSKNDRKNTATLTGSRFSEKITLDGETLNGYTKTINAGNGNNTITVNSEGKVTINSGSNVDNITVNTNSNATISSGAGDDTIITSDGNDTISAGDGEDKITAGKGNDKLTGGKGKDTFIFNKNDGVDTITDATAEDIIQINGVNKDELVFAKNGNSLEIFYSDEFDINNKIIVQNHFTKKGRIATTLQVGGENPIDLSTVECATSGSGKISGSANANNNTIIGSAKADIIKAGAGNDTIIAKGGNDSIYGVDGNNTMVFTTGDGVDTIYSGKGNDTIVLSDVDSIENIKLYNNGTDLTVQYSDDDKIVLNQFYKNYNINNHSVKFIQLQGEEAPVAMEDFITSCQNLSHYYVSGSGTIKGTQGNDIIDGSSKNDTITAGLGDDKINAKKGTNTIIFNQGNGNDIIENGNGTDTIKINAIITNARQVGDDLVISYGMGDSVTIENYYIQNHSAKYVVSAQTFGNSNKININELQARLEGGDNGGNNEEDNTNNYQIKVNGTLSDVMFDNGQVITPSNNRTNYIYANDEGSTLTAAPSVRNYLIGGAGDDTLIGKSGSDEFIGGSGNNTIKVAQSGGADFISVASKDDNNTIVFDNITFATNDQGDVTGLGNLQLVDSLNNYQSDDLYIKGYGASSDYITARNYFYTGETKNSYYYDGYTLQDKNGNRISLSDAVKISINNGTINREADTDYTVGKLNGNSTNETFYTNSTDEAREQISTIETMNGYVDGGSGDDTIYSGGIYQYEKGGTLRPVIIGNDGNDEIHAEGGKIYFTTSREDLIYSDSNLIAIQKHSTNGQTTTTTIYDTDHIYITPDNKVMTGYFFFAYQINTDEQGNKTVESIKLDESDKYEYIGTYNYDEADMDVHVYHTDNLMDSKIEGKKTYFFDYGDKVASGQVTINGNDGDDTIYIGNGSTANGGAGNDTIIGDGIAYGDDGNDKIIFNNNNFYMDGLGYTYYYVDGGKGNDSIDLKEVITREHEPIELTSGTVEYEYEYDTQILFSEGIDTLIVNPKDNKNIIIDMTQFSNAQKQNSVSDTQYGAFKRGDDLYLTMNNGSNKNGTLIIKDYFAYEKDPNEPDGIKKDQYGDPIRVFSNERRASIKVWFDPSVRYYQDYFLPASYMSVDEFVQHYEEWNQAVDTNADGHKDYEYYNHTIDKINTPSGTIGYDGRHTTETNAYYQFKDNQKDNDDVVNPSKETPEYFSKEYQAYAMDPNNPTLVGYQDVKVYHKAGWYIIGRNGDDTIYGGNGDDVIFADNLGFFDEEGNWIDNTNGKDNEQGEGGYRNYIYAGDGDDYIEGGMGKDFIDGGNGQNVIYGKDGNDTLIAGKVAGANSYSDKTEVYGGKGNDTIYSQAILNNDGTINEEASNTYLGGEENTGKQYLYGEEGDDTIIANGYTTDVEAGAGNDTVHFYNNNGSTDGWYYNDVNRISLGAGNDKFYAHGNGAYNLQADSGNNLIDATDSTANGSYIFGGSGVDTIYGGSGKETIYTGIGDSEVYAGDGDDTIYSGVDDYYIAQDLHKSDIIHGGGGNDTIDAKGKSIVYGDEGDDIIYLKGSSRYVPSALTVDGGAGDDTYRVYGYEGVNTILTSEGFDKIQFMDIQSQAFKMFKKNDDLVIQTTRNNNGAAQTGLTILKDYYKEQTKALFNNWIVETYSDDEKGPKRGMYTMAEFIKYVSGNSVITTGVGTDNNDFIEAADEILEIDGRGGNDNIIAGTVNRGREPKTQTIKGGSGSDYILTQQADYENKQIIIGDSGSATVVDNGDIYGTINVSYTINYTPSTNSSNDGNDNIVSYGERSFIWGEGGDDIINVMNGSHNHIWGGKGSDIINVVAKNNYNYASAQQIYGEEGNDYIKARAAFIDGGVGNDTIIHKFGGTTSGYSYDSYQIKQDILKNQYNATSAWMNKYFNWDNNDVIDITRKSSQLQVAKQDIQKVQNDISYYKWMLNQCEINNRDYYGYMSLNEIRNGLADLEATYYGIKTTWENYSKPIQDAYNADIAANNQESLNGTKGTKDNYIDAILNENSTAQEVELAQNAYEADLELIRKYKNYIINFNDLDYSDKWDYISPKDEHGNDLFNGFREEAGDEGVDYWKNKLNQAELHLNGIEGTKEAYDKLTGSMEYAKYNNYTRELEDVAYALEHIGQNAPYEGMSFRTYSKEYWENKIIELDNYRTGNFEGTKQAYERIKSYVDNYDNNEWNTDNYTAPDGTNYATFRDEGNKAYWQGKLEIAQAAYKKDVYLYQLYGNYSKFFYDNDFVDTNYAQHTSYVDKEGNAIYANFREEAINEANLWYDGNYQSYWYYMQKLTSWHMDGYQGTIAAADEYWQRYQGHNVPYSTYKEFYYADLRISEKIDSIVDYYDRYDDETYLGRIGYQYYSIDQLNDTKNNLEISLNGTSKEYETLKQELAQLVKDFKDTAPSETALKIMPYLSSDIILGGDGDDTIEIGHTDEDDENVQCGEALVMGQEGNDTYIIGSIVDENYAYSIESTKITIYDTEGTNTLKFTTDKLKSGNVGMYANVVLKKDDDGNLIQDNNGNYEYELLNFSSENNLSNTPLYDGNSDYAIVFLNVDSYKNSLNTYLGARRQEGVRLDVDTLNTIDYVWSQDGKYITRTQINSALQNTANYLAQHGFDNLLSAIDTNLDNAQWNLEELRNFQNLGSLEWITPTTPNQPNENDIIAPVTQGLIGTNTNDTLTINSSPAFVEGELNNIIDLKLGNDKVVFTGEFGDYVIKSDSTTDNNNRARQADTISFKGYSVKDGSLKFSQDGNDLIVTAYNGEDKVGSITYKDFLGANYALRSFLLQADDNEYLVSKETATLHENAGSNVESISVRDDENPYCNIRFIESTDGTKVNLSTNGNRSYYYVIGDTPISLNSIKEGEPVEIFSQGYTDDSYRESLREDVNLIIHDNNGTNELKIGGVKWDGSGAVSDTSARFFFDIDKDGNVSTTKHIILAKCFKPTIVYKKYTDSSQTYYENVEETSYAVDDLIGLLNNDSNHMKGVITFDGSLYRIQTDDHYDHNERLVYEEDVDTSILPEKYIKGILTDVIPWLKENNYESVSDALTKLKANITTTQELMEDVETDSVEFNNYKNAIEASQNKIDELLKMFDMGYDDVLITNMFGTDGDDELTATSTWNGGRTKRIEGGKGNDVISKGYNAALKDIIYSFDRGDGFDTIIGSTKDAAIYVDKANKTMFTKLRAAGWDLNIEFYSNNEAIQNPVGSITIKDYFRQQEDDRLDKFVIQSTGQEDEVLSIKELLTTNLINNNVSFSTKNDDNFASSENNRIIYLGASNNNTTDTVQNSQGNDEIYISKDEPKTNIIYTVCQGGDDIICGSKLDTGLIVDFANINAQVEYRKINNDMKMLFFTGDGNNKQKVGSITFKDYYINDSKIGNGIIKDHNNFIFRTGTGENIVDERVNSVTLLENYRLLGGSLEDNNDEPYFKETVANALQNTEIPVASTQNLLVFNDVESFRDLSFNKNGNDLVITHSGKTTTIKDYTTGNSSIGYLRVGNLVKNLNNNKAMPTVDLNVPNIVEADSYNQVNAVIGTITGTGNADSIEVTSNFNGVEKISAEGGNDKIVVNNNNINIDAGWGDDIITITGSGNTIRGNRGNDIINITAGNGETNLIIFDGNEYGEWGGSSYCGNDIINAKGGNLELEFSDQWLDDFKLARKDNYLAIRYNNCNNTIFIKDYFVNDAKNPEIANIILVSHKNHAKITLDDLITQNYSSTTGLFEVWGTEGDDKFIHENISGQSVTYNFNKGNDVLEFVNIAESYKDDVTRFATVNSIAESDKGNVTNTDTIIMGGYPDGGIDYQNEHRYAFADNDGGIIVSAIHTSTYGHKDIVTEVNYNDFLNKVNGVWKTPELQIKDFENEEYPYVVKRYDGVQNIDLATTYYDEETNYLEKVEAIFIKANSGTSYINSANGSKTNILTDGGAKLDYTGYGGERITTNSTTSNDTYSIYTGNSLYIKDNGGNDTLNFTNVNYDEEYMTQYPDATWCNGLKGLYLAFNVDKDGNTDDTFVITNSSEKSVYYAKNILSGNSDTTSASVIVEAKKNQGKLVGIENVTASKQIVIGEDEYGYDIYGQQKICDIDIESWYGQIKEEVVEWLTEKNQNSTAEVFALNDSNYQLVQSLSAIYEKYTANDFIQQ